MKFKEIRENDTNKEPEQKTDKKGNKKPKKGRFTFKETVTHGTDYVNRTAEKTKAAMKEMQVEAWASTKMAWKGYALLIANYYNNEYDNNVDFILKALEKLNNKKQLSQKDIKKMEILVSLNDLKYYIINDDLKREIDINLELIQRDFFEAEFDPKIYHELIDESDADGHSISYLLEVYDLLISFVMNKKTREIFYKAVVEKEKKDAKKNGHPIIITSKVIKSFDVKNYLSSKFKKKAMIYEY